MLDMFRRLERSIGGRRILFENALTQAEIEHNSVHIQEESSKPLEIANASNLESNTCIQDAPEPCPLPRPQLQMENDHPNAQDLQDVKIVRELEDVKHFAKVARQQDYSLAAEDKMRRSHTEILSDPLLRGNMVDAFPKSARPDLFSALGIEKSDNPFSL